MKFQKLKEYGINDYFIKQIENENLKVGRVISQYNEIYKIITEHGEMLSEVSGKFRYNVKNISDYPAVGDFVIVEYDEENLLGSCIIQKVLNRKSVFKRKGVEDSHRFQIVGTNIDLVFICTSLNQNYSLNRIERYVALALDGGITPIIVLTKSDLCENVDDVLFEISNNIIGVDVIVTSNKNKSSYDQVFKYLKSGMTSCFVGSSGVGKSTFVNYLIGENKFATNSLSNDDKGKHTTTRRELILLKNGGIVIDTPGMREVGVEFSDIEKSFSDIEEMAMKCKFKDCTHRNEPKCFVREQIENGNLDIRRFESYEKLKKESLYDELSSREIENKKCEMMFKDFGGMKNARKYIKNNFKR